MTVHSANFRWHETMDSGAVVLGPGLVTVVSDVLGPPAKHSCIMKSVTQTPSSIMTIALLVLVSLIAVVLFSRPCKQGPREPLTHLPARRTVFIMDRRGRIARGLWERPKLIRLPLRERGKGQIGKGQGYLSQSKEKRRSRFPRRGNSEILSFHQQSYSPT